MASGTSAHRARAWPFLLIAFLGGCAAWDAGIEPLDPPGHALPPAPTVSSLTPTLSWKPFKIDNPAVSETLRYQIVVYRRDGSFSGKKIIDYERSGIVGTSHTLTTPLQPHTRYYWRIGATYLQRGEEIATGWSGYNYIFLFPPLIGIGTGEAYSFVTP